MSSRSCSGRGWPRLAVWGEAPAGRLRGFAALWQESYPIRRVPPSMLEGGFSPIAA